MGMEKEDVGLYTCVAENMNGVAHTTCKLTLAEPPKEMRSPDVPQVFGHSALAVWKASEARPPVSHTLEKRTVWPWKESTCCWEVVASEITDTYYHIRNLQPGHSYQIRVACANKAGHGPFSSPSVTFHLSGKAPHQ
uniref:striated muscle-specific serine/threonine-protein kinase-like isoform X2 n=1 Tax=Myxine glutinosa TaxID=7769 RepID=UPI00358F300B